MNLDFFDLRDRPGCLGGLLRLFALRWVYGWLQDNVGRGRGGCVGGGCGVILFIIFVVMACGIVTGTNWFEFGF
jgi:hypothetical protein